MYEVTDIERLILSVIDQVKKQYPAGKYMKPEIPEYYITYKEAIKFRDRVNVHAEIGIFPEHLFKAKAPNMTDVEYTYLKENYKQTTLPVWVDFISTISLPFQDGNWSIQYHEDDSAFVTSGETLQAYVENDIDKYGSLENFMKYTVPHLKSVDANGVIVVKPAYIPKVNDTDDVDTGELLKPQPYYYRCDQIISKGEDYYLILLDERSEVTYSNAKKKVGFIFEFYDEYNIYRITQVGDYVDFKFTIELYFSHNEDKVPVNEFKGIPKIVGNSIVWMPSFIYACDNLDLALMNAQYIQVSCTFACFPYLVMVGDDCDYETSDSASGQVINCVDGHLDYPNQQRRKCPKCNGSGMKDRTTPFGRLLLKKGDNWSGEGDSKIAGQAMYYVSPDTTALEFVSTKIEKDTAAARDIMHLQRSNTIVKGSENKTATGESLDQKAKFAFVKPQSDQIFEMYEFIYDRIGWQRYGDKYKKPVINYPNTFDYNTEEDYINRIVDAQNAGYPPYIIQTIFYRYLHTLYFHEKRTSDVFTLINHVDRLLVISQDDINLKLTRGLVDKWEIVLHDSAISFVDELISENAKFFEQDFEVQKQQLIDKAKKKTTELTASTPAQTTVNDIINNQ